MTSRIANSNFYHVVPDRTNRPRLTEAALTELCARFEAECRARGLRRTPQRLAVFRTVARDPGHPTADAVYRRLRRAMPSLSLATVYRALESLAREGFVRRVGSGEGTARFDADPTPHQHLVCRSCGRLEDAAYEPFNRLVPPAEGPDGFAPEALDIRIIGLCRRCRRRARAAARSGRKT